MSELVTGDAVVLDVKVAQLPVRVVSAFIDIFVQMIVLYGGIFVVAFSLSQFDAALTGALSIVYSVLALVGYPVIWEMATRGRSLGKIAMGLRVVSDDGGPERLRQAVIRALSAVVEIFMFMGAPAVIASLASAKGKRLGDIFAGTMVISERGPKLPPPPMMPPQLAQWAQSLQLSGLTSDQADLARQFLNRAGQLAPHTRDQMLYQISTDVLASIAPPPPPGTPPQFMLAAVLAERHRRALAQMRPDYPATPPPAPSAPPAPEPSESSTGRSGFATPG
ncbi:RDD domain-containing protein [Mycobacteroides abscessus subsp. bolletii]|uniref:RDD domain-containing protein n=1 Tax=Mycobacteroides abscessus subsp. bolletii TaxID=319705 RepID=A0A9Q7WKE1_9MYCO|nr:RDD domain-containing protein [Mycobacteroides abscessus subsp. bolletii]SHU56930.1 RDD domain-containing protein [Mycobacteroides abscessus subsp. bolletii]SHU74656.1 RDD domain-containing protein [Mycobacteroides abscessus subsp. bolletii]SHW72635.1 RDD domain-containing protein [Mycobacteroides abscessus subsp. bolletii]SHX32701.1 RDD domain-containing protein [Mycobacteroides abscessus subsp. bolletii]